MQEEFTITDVLLTFRKYVEVEFKTEKTYKSIIDENSKTERKIHGITVRVYQTEKKKSHSSTSNIVASGIFIARSLTRKPKSALGFVLKPTPIGKEYHDVKYERAKENAIKAINLLEVKNLRKAIERAKSLY